MYTSMLLVALTGLPVAADADGAPAWQTNYSQAKKLAATEQKPLAIFIGAGASGWNQLSRDGKLGKEIEQTLAEKYLPVYLDSTTEQGRKLATAMGINDKVGIVISDARGEMMAFYHEGDLARSDLARYLARYSDPTRRVDFTESNPSHGGYQSYYPPVGGSYCPNCAGGRRR